MNLNTKLAIVEQMFDIYDRFIGAFDFACEKFCAHCCTANVTMTTLEGYRIVSQFMKNGAMDELKTIVEKSHPHRFVP